MIYICMIWTKILYIYIKKLYCSVEITVSKKYYIFWISLCKVIKYNLKVIKIIFIVIKLVDKPINFSILFFKI